MQAVEFTKIVVARTIVITAWRAPGSKTVNSTIKWGDGTYSPVISDCHTDLSPYDWIWEKYNFKKRAYYTFKVVVMNDIIPPTWRMHAA